MACSLTCPFEKESIHGSGPSIEEFLISRSIKLIYTCRARPLRILICMFVAKNLQSVFIRLPGLFKKYPDWMTSEIANGDDSVGQKQMVS